MTRFKRTKRSHLAAPLLAVITLAAVPGPFATAQTPVGTSFTYQGQLKQGGAPADGLFDLQLTLWDDPLGGARVGPALTKLNVPVARGLFTLELDFGDVFDGGARWLELSVAPAGSPDSTTLAPRQRLSATPYAVSSARAGLAARSATADDLACANCVSESELAFDVATEAELGFHKTSGDHDGRYVKKTGDSMTGPLTVPTDGLSVGSDQLALSGGRVGIGTSSPGALLEVGSDPAGFLQVTDNSTTIIRHDNNVFSQHLRLQNLYSSTGGGADEVGQGILFELARTGDPTPRPAGKLGVRREQEWSSDDASNDSYMAFSTVGDGVMAERLRISGSGNVGVGTTTPSSAIEVRGGRIAVDNRVPGRESERRAGFGKRLCTAFEAARGGSCDFWTASISGGLIVIHEWHNNQAGNFGQKIYMITGGGPDSPGLVTLIASQGSNDCSLSFVGPDSGPDEAFQHRWRVTNTRTSVSDQGCAAFYLPFF